MNKEVVTILMASLLIAASGVAPALSAADDKVEPDAAVQAVGQADEPQVAVPDTPPVAEQAPQPVTGAFGIPLGERFEPCMVAKVISQEEKSYRGPNKVEAQGTLYRVEPKVPNTLFATYAVATTADGLIYAIRGDQEPAEPRPACEAPKALAAFLTTKYGKPSSVGPAGDWYGFRDRLRPNSRSVRLHATRCGRGIYSIVYSDDGVRLGASAPKPEPSDTSGL